MVQNAISMGMDAVKAVHASIAEIEAFHVAEEARLVQVAKQEKAKQEKIQAFKDKLNKFHQLHSGTSMAEKMAAAIFYTYITKSNSLPEPGQKQDMRSDVIKSFADLFGMELEEKSWNGNHALLCSGSTAALRLACFFMNQDEKETAGKMKSNQIHYRETKMKRK